MPLRLAVLTLTPAARRATAGLPSRAAADDLAVTTTVRSTDPQPITGLLPHLAALHAATRTTAPAPEAWPDDPEPTPAPGESFLLPETAPVRLADGIPHRASAPAGYRPEPISPRELAQILAAASTGCPGDLPGLSPMVTLYLLALRIQGLPVGAYRYDAELRALAPVAAEPATHETISEPALRGTISESALRGIASEPVRRGIASESARHGIASESVARITSGPLAPNTRIGLQGAAAVLVPVGDPLGGVRWFGDRWYRIQQAGTGLAVHRATLAAAALGVASRIHSDGTTPATQAALGLTGTRRQALSFLLLGRPPIGPSLIRRLPAAAVDDVGSGDGTAPTPRVGAIHPLHDGRNHVRQTQPRP